MAFCKTTYSNGHQHNLLPARQRLWGKRVMQNLHDAHKFSIKESQRLQCTEMMYRKYAHF